MISANVAQKSRDNWRNQETMLKDMAQELLEF